MNTRIPTAAFVALSLLPSAAARAQFTANGTGVCTLPAGQFHPMATSDGAGGAIVAWEDRRNQATSGLDVYAQRLDANGFALWTAGGIPLCVEVGDQDFLAIVGDGAGGAIVAWNDRRSGSATIYAQRVSTAGSPLWPVGGVALCSAAPEQSFPAIASDGAGGAIVAWQDSRTGDFDLYAQRVDASGAIQWTGNAKPVCTVTGLQHAPVITADGAGGAILAWTDERSGVADIYAQRLDAAGSPLWILNGAAVCTASLFQGGPSLASDGAGGAIIAWVDGRTGAQLNRRNIFSQRMNSAGIAQWTLNGISVCSANGEQQFPLIISDGAGGAVYVWTDLRSANLDIYGARFDSNGSAVWGGGGGSALCTENNQQQLTSIAPDGTGGVIAAWLDTRGPLGNDVYAQRMDGNGGVRWAVNGAALCTLEHSQSGASVVPDGISGAIIAWHDMRSWDGVSQPNVDFNDIYANRVTASGWVATDVSNIPPARAVLAPNFPNPFSDATRFDLVLDHASRVAIDVFDVAGRRVRHVEIMNAPTGRTTVTFDGRDDQGHLLPSGAYFYRVNAGTSQFTRKILIVR